MSAYTGVQAEGIPQSCMLCDTWCTEGYHTACMLREVVGGVGHLLDHFRWCVQEGDPDAGLGFRGSAVCVAALCDRFDVAAVVIGDFPRPTLEEVRAWANL